MRGHDRFHHGDVDGWDGIARLRSGGEVHVADVELPDGQTGEIEANSKSMTNKGDSVYCGYFTDDYQESLGYYFAHLESVPVDGAAVLEICLDSFEGRFGA